MISLRRQRREKIPLRQKVGEIMDPDQNVGYFFGPHLAVNLFVLVCIVASSTLVILEHFIEIESGLYWTLEISFTTIFVVEYLLRWYSAPSRVKYPFKFFAIIDLLAILPSILILGSDFLLLRLVRGMRMLRILRLLRLVRLLKLFRHGQTFYRGIIHLRTWYNSLHYRYNLGALGRLLLFTILAWFVGTNVLHLTESELVGGQGPFADYWKSYWNTIIVLVSGIEDKEPLSILGRVEMTLMLIIGITIIGMLTGEIVSILVRKAERSGKVALKPPHAKLEDHIVILGKNSHLDNIVKQLHEAYRGELYTLVIAPDAEDMQVTNSKAYQRVFAISGDPTGERFLELADLDTVLRVIVLSPDEEPDEKCCDNRTLMTTIATVNRYAGKPIVVELQSEDSLVYASHLHNMANVDFLVSRQIGERLLTQAVLSPGVTKVYDDLMTFSETTNEFYTTPAPEPVVGKTFQEAQLYFLELEAEHLVLVGIDRSPKNRPNVTFHLNPQEGMDNLTEADMVIGEDDRLIVLGFECPSWAQL